MASVDPGLLLGQLREEQAELRRRWVTGGEDPIFLGCLFFGGKIQDTTKKAKGGAAWPFLTVPKKT